MVRAGGSLGVDFLLTGLPAAVGVQDRSGPKAALNSLSTGSGNFHHGKYYR